MLVNADFSRSAVIAPDEYRWVGSPQDGVERMMLDRLGGEKARATSLVRYAPGSDFPAHLHPGGEEILVLSGTFSELDQHYGAGWYLRNPPGSFHQPSSREGATLFVKLWQMPADEHAAVRIDTNNPEAWQRRSGREVCALYQNGIEEVRLERLDAGEPLFNGVVDSVELLVLAGVLIFNDRQYTDGSWIRLPAAIATDLRAGKEGVTLYLKTGHLAALSEECRSC